MATSVYELLKMNESLVRVMMASGVDPSMISQVEAYELYMEMTREGMKKEYVYAVINSRFGMSRTTIIRLVKKMQGDISLSETKKVR